MPIVPPTGLSKVWWNICEYFREAFGIYGEEEAAHYGYVHTGERDTDAGNEAKDFNESQLIPKLRAYNAPEEVIQMVQAAGELSWPNNIIFTNLVTFSFYQSVFRGWLGVASLPVQYQIMGELGIARPDPNAAWLMHWRGLSGDTKDSYLNDLGWTPEMINYFGEISKPRLSPGDMFRHMHLTGGGAADVYNEMSRRGYTAEDTGAASVLSQFIPGPADLVRMAVREAWDDGVAAQWGYDQDRSPEFVAEMQRQGDKEGWAEKYWRAHWELPGVTLGMEMLHRVPEFGIAEFKQLLKISDIPATFRDYISKIAYRTLTRVDVRRMHATGTLSTAEVKRSYLDFGYNERDATRMTDFTVRFNTDKERELTKADILGGFKSGTISRSDTLSWLQQLGYDANTASLLVLREETKMAQTYVNEQVKYVKTLYTNGDITEADARTRLGTLGLDGERITQYIAEWTITRISKTQRPSQSVLDKFFRRDVISQGEYLTGLDNLGFGAEYAGWYLDSVLDDKAEDARKAEEAARKEQDDIRLRDIKSDYQINKAVIDVDIAELQTAIAETQLALRARKLRFDRDVAITERIGTSAEIKEQAATDTKAVEAEIKGLQTASVNKRASIEVLQTEIAAIELASTPQPKDISPGEMAVAIRERIVQISILDEEIEGYQTEIAATEVAILEMTEEADIVAAELEIANRKLSIELVQDAIAVIETEIASIELTRTIQVIEIPVDIAETEIATRRLAIEVAQDDIATITVDVATLREELTAIAATLIADLEIAEIAMNVAELEREYAVDLAEWTSKLDNFRVNLAVLREQKAALTVEYREGIAP